LRLEGYTVDISPRGCLVVVVQDLAEGQRLRLINLANENCARLSPFGAGTSVQRVGKWALNFRNPA